MTNLNNNIFIIGAGAIGKVLAVALKLEGKNVVIIRGSTDNQPAQMEKIEIGLNDNTEIEATIEVSTLSNFTTLDGTVVLTNKSYGNARLSAMLKDKINNASLVILQNGLGVEQAFTSNGFTEVYRCVLFATSNIVAANKLMFKPVAVSPIGSIKSDIDNSSAIAAQLNSPHFQFKAEKNIQPIIWKKAIVNSVFNSVCPLLEVDNGIFHRNEKALAIAKRIIAECIGIAGETGVVLSSDEVVESLLMISRFSDGLLISTYNDILHKRKTEIETLNFAIVDIAKQLGKESAVTETKLLGELTKLKSDLNQ